MWSLFCPYLFLIFLTFSASGGLCLMILVCPGYLHLYFNTAGRQPYCVIYLKLMAQSQSMQKCFLRSNLKTIYIACSCISVYILDKYNY